MDSLQCDRNDMIVLKKILFTMWIMKFSLYFLPHLATLHICHRLVISLVISTCLNLLFVRCARPARLALTRSALQSHGLTCARLTCHALARPALSSPGSPTHFIYVETRSLLSVFSNFNLYPCIVTQNKLIPAIFPNKCQI